MSVLDAPAEVLRPNELEGIDKPQETARGLPPRLYTDPEIFEVEKEKIFRREWMAVFHESSVPNPGDFRVMEIAGDSFLFTRGDDGVLRAFHNICRHRGAKVATGEGNCSRFKCPYHTWTYDTNGKLVGAPAMAHVVREGIGLLEVSVTTWMGFVFINQDPDAQPLAERLAGLNEELGAFLNAGRLAHLYEIPYPGDWNWKLTNENAYESYHVLGSHFESAGALIPGELTYTRNTEFEYWSTFFNPYGEGLNSRDTTGGAVPFDNLPDWIDQELRFYTIWPNIIVFFGPEAIFAGITIPGPTHDRVSFNWNAAVLPESTRLPKFEEFREGQMLVSNTIQTEDQYPCETMWANVHSKAFIPGPYADQELASFHFDQWWLRRMAA